MAKIDPRLRFLSARADTLASETLEHFSIVEDVGVDPNPPVEVLVRLSAREGEEDAVEKIRKAGMTVRTTTSGPFPVACGTIPLDLLDALEQIADVRRVEASRPLVSELDLCVPEIRADVVHNASPAVRGAGTFVGIIDGGIDFRHPDFRTSGGATRIRFLWDQGAPQVAGGPVPYGREYTQAEIDAVLDGTAPASSVPHTDLGGHGTHVAGIASGCGRAQASHVGLAPEADLIVVSLNTEGQQTLGQSARALEAFTYVVDRAAGAPVAINFSQGMNGGGHVGETVLETGLDNLARRPNVVIVKSAGNEQTWNTHAGGAIAEGQTVALSLDVQTNDRFDDIIEVWYDDADAISVALRPPGGAPTAFVSPGAGSVFTTPGGNMVSVDVDANADGTGDTVATVILASGSAPMVQPGEWTILLRAGNVRVGRYDAWIERTNRSVHGEQTRFAEASAEPERTISVPGTARNVITVGSYITRPDAPPDLTVGAISTFSSRGPTRYGRLKPEICAPGQLIESARVGTVNLIGNRGTSMAAPIVTGASALVLSRRPGLNSVQVKQILMRSARRTGAAAEAPNNTWGSGKIDVEAALDVAATVEFPTISNVRVNGATVSWDTDIPTTGAVRYLPNLRQLQLGKNALSEVDLTLATSHSVTLGAAEPGVYFCEIVAFSKENFFTEDDNDGLGYEAKVGKQLGDEQIEALAAFENAAEAASINRNCPLQPYTRIDVQAFSVDDTFVAFASPDSTFAVTKRFIEAAERSILIGIYDFTASYVKDLLIKALSRGVAVSLMLDLDGRTGEPEVFEELGRYGCRVVPAPSCASAHARYFASSHEKVVVVDDEWVLVQSGNYSESSIPWNEGDGQIVGAFVPGNRDMGVAVKSPQLARFFTEILTSDMQLELNSTPSESVPSAMAALSPLELFAEAPEQVPARLFPSVTLRPSSPVRVLPVLTPDNYMRDIPDLIRAARRSIYVEQQYIRTAQPNIGLLLEAIRAARASSPNLDVRIIVAKPFPGRSYDSDSQAIVNIATSLGLAMGDNVRLLNPRHFVHCHNKLVVVDDEAVLVSSQNWSDFAVVKNREAGLWIEYPELARYYSAIFQSDWETGLPQIPPQGTPEFFGPESLASGKTVPLNLGDYVET